MKRTILKKIQGDKIGTKPVVEFKYSQDTQEEMEEAEVEVALDHPPAKLPVEPSATIPSQRTTTGPSNKRKLKDVL